MAQCVPTFDEGHCTLHTSFAHFLPIYIQADIVAFGNATAVVSELHEQMMFAGRDLYYWISIIAMYTYETDCSLNDRLNS